MTDWTWEWWALYAAACYLLFWPLLGWFFTWMDDGEADEDFDRMFANHWWLSPLLLPVYLALLIGFFVFHYSQPLLQWFLFGKRRQQ